MNKIIILLAVIVFVSAKRDPKYEDYLKKFNKKIDDLPEDVQERRQKNFFKNLDFIEKTNKEKRNFTLAINEFTDRDVETFNKERCGYLPRAETRALPATPAPATPAWAPYSVDFRNYAQAIANQGACGSCWAFATVALLEMYHSMRGNFWAALSEQQLVDCDTTNSGCRGGSPANALDFIRNRLSSKVATDSEYPYFSGSTQSGGSCRNVFNPKNVAYNSKYEFFPNGDEELLKNYVYYYGPVLIGMYVSNSGYFNFYNGGVFYDWTCPVNDCNQRNHAMLVVGYGTDDWYGDYWIVRNSYGTGWGEQGYIRMARNAGNNCNVACHGILLT